MLSTLYKMLLACLKPSKFFQEIGRDDDSVDSSELSAASGIQDGVIWNCASGTHASGDFSFAVVQSNTHMEDFSRLESGPFGTFAGVFDGHGGHQAASYVADHLFSNLLRGLLELQGGVLSNFFVPESFEEGTVT